MEQDSTLSPILSVLYIMPFFEIRAQALNLSTSILSFLNNSLLIYQGDICNTTLPELYSSYRVVIDLMILFGLVIEHDK